MMGQNPSMPSAPIYKRTHLKALRNAVAFAHDTRWEPATDSDHHGGTRGLDAYGLWREAIESGDAAPEHSQYHAYDLKVFRGHAATYLRELTGIFPAVYSELAQAATDYIRLAETANTLHDLCAEAKNAGGFSDEARAEAARLVTAAQKSDRSAIASIEAALVVLDESQ